MNFTNCHNEGNVKNRATGSGSYCYVAGIDGYHAGGEIKDCTNSGKIDSYTGYLYIGGIAADNGYVTRCINTGDITIVVGDNRLGSYKLRKIITKLWPNISCKKVKNI